MVGLNEYIFFVDGQSDLKAIKAKIEKEFRKTPGFRLINCNGRDVSAKGYVNALYPAVIVASHQRYRRFICVVDREGRRCSAKKFANEVKRELNSRLSHSNTKIDIDVCCADVMLENWIVSDLLGISVCNDIDCCIEQDVFDGQNGAAILKKILKTKYKKSAHAQLLFKYVDLKRGRENSPSFDYFCSTLDIK